MSHLFSPVQIKNVLIKNRIVMPPMVCFGWAGHDGMVTEDHIRHYEARAKGGTGLIILEATCINKDGRLTDSQLGIWSDEHIQGLRKIADACHRHGSIVLVQIHHAGFKTHPNVIDTPLCSSDYADNDRKAREMSMEELHSIQQDYVQAALRAKKAGFDGIELHGAHGYLISQFMSPLVNRRTDQYGGELKNRMKFALEIIKSIREAIGDSFIYGYRMGGNEPDLENGIEIAKALEAHGIDLLHVSAGISSNASYPVPEEFPYNWIVYHGTRIKEQVSIPVIVVNDIRTPERAAYLIEKGLADFAAIGKSMLVDAEWSNKAKEGLETSACLKCPRCQWFTDGKRCPKNR